MKISQEIKSHLIYSEAPIRAAAIELFPAQFDTVLEELDVEQGKARIDLVLVGKYLHGIELKSDGDSLSRLPNQINHYSRTFDKVTIIAGYSHVYEVIEMVPYWWGIIAVELDKNGKLCFVKMRSAKHNPQLNPHSLAKLLNRREVLKILAETDNIYGFRSRPSQIIREHLAESLELEQLQFHVKQELIARTDRRVGVLSM